MRYSLWPWTPIPLSYHSSRGFQWEWDLGTAISRLKALGSMSFHGSQCLLGLKPSLKP